MSEYVADLDVVKDAADRLDKLVGKISWLTSDWRSRINLDILDMNSVDNCILGQLAGDYVQALRDIDAYDYNFSRSGFCSYRIAWGKYLKGDCKFAIGARWAAKYGGADLAIKGSVEIDGTVFYAVVCGGDPFLRTATELESAYKYDPKPIFTKGQEVRFARQGDAVRFYYLNDSRILRVYGNGKISYGSLAYYEGVCGTASAGELNIDYILSDVIGKA
jgi:hypothetical protein